MTREDLEDLVKLTQADAFEYGRSFGRRECADLFNRCQKDGSDFMSELLINCPKSTITAKCPPQTMSKCAKCGRKPEVPGPCPDCGHVMGEPFESTWTGVCGGCHYAIEHCKCSEIYGKPCPPPPLDHQLLTDLEAWRAYLRVWVERMSTTEVSKWQKESFKAFAISDDQLALSLNKAIGEPKADWLKDYNPPIGGEK